jgi:hypothetical protein
MILPSGLYSQFQLGGRACTEGCKEETTVPITHGAPHASIPLNQDCYVLYTQLSRACVSCSKAHRISQLHYEPYTSHLIMDQRYKDIHRT